LEVANLEATVLENDVEYFPGIEKDHERTFLRNHGIPWQKEKKDEFCKIGAINIYFKSILLSRPRSRLTARFMKKAIYFVKQKYNSKIQVKVDRLLK
jgi:hypothetical protein